MSDCPTIIVVDDEQKILDALGRIFEMENINSFMTTDPNEALKVLENKSVKIFITDFSMPQMNGVTLLKKVYELRPSVKRILLTGQASMDSVVEAINLGHIYRYIAKPWDESDLLLTIKEATALYDLEDENRRLLLVTQRQLRALQALDKLKSDFIANVSHELRTPVNCINLIVENILDGVAGDFEEFNPMIKKYILKAKNNVDNLRSIIDDLLDIFKLSDENYELNLQNHDLSELIEMECDSCSELAIGKGIVFNKIIETGVRADVDAKRIGQVIRNLLSNAIKFTESGGKVEVNLYVEDGCRIVITVKDSGKGIPEEDLERVFDRFSQVEDKVSGKPVGTGLGLAISKKIINLHNGVIKAISQLAQGAEFVINLPVCLNGEHIEG